MIKIVTATTVAAVLAFSAPAQGDTVDLLVDGTISAVVTGSMVAVRRLVVA